VVEDDDDDDDDDGGDARLLLLLFLLSVLDTNYFDQKQKISWTEQEGIRRWNNLS